MHRLIDNGRLRIFGDPVNHEAAKDTRQHK